MRTFIYRFWALPIVVALASCSGSPEPAAQSVRKDPASHVFIVDVSVSTANQTDMTVANAVERWIGEDMAQTVQLGDRVAVFEAGSRSAERMVARLNLVTDYKLRVPVARERVVQAIRDSAARFEDRGGDNATNLLLGLESIHPACTPRTTVTLVTDGVEESDAYSASEALMAGRPVTLPAPPSAYLKGCRVQLVGFGLTADLGADAAQILPTKHLVSLKRGWQAYLQQAGVRPQDIAFISSL